MTVCNRYLPDALKGADTKEVAAILGKRIFLCLN